MNPTADQLAGLNVALNEARFTGFEFDPIRCRARVELVVRVLGEGQAPAEEIPVAIRLLSVGRIAAAVDGSERGRPRLDVQQLSELVASYGGTPIYGWEFFDRDLTRQKWLERSNLDYRTGRGASNHSLYLFQEVQGPGLDLCLWFDELEIEASLDLDALIAGGIRWWDALYANDPRTHGSGIFPLSSK